MYQSTTAREAVASMTTSPTIADLLPSWRRSMLARNLVPHSITMYLLAAEGLAKYLEAQGMPLAVASISREHIEAYMTLDLQVCKAASVLSHYTKIRQFFKWLVEEGEITASPMERIKAPRQPRETPPAVLSDDDLKRLLAACAGGAFQERRDLAVLSVLLDTGLRVSELCALTLADLDLDTGAIMVKQGKGRKDRIVFIGQKTAAALDRYMRLRRSHAQAQEYANLWLTSRNRGPCTDEAIRRLIEKRARMAGIDRHLWPHLFRHTFADRWLRNGGQESDLLTIAGWSSSAMLARYGASAKVARAQIAHKQFSPADRL